VPLTMMQSYALVPERVEVPLKGVQTAEAAGTRAASPNARQAIAAECRLHITA